MLLLSPFHGSTKFATHMSFVAVAIFTNRFTSPLGTSYKFEPSVQYVGEDTLLCTALCQLSRLPMFCFHYNVQ